MYNPRSGYIDQSVLTKFSDNLHRRTTAAARDYDWQQYALRGSLVQAIKEFRAQTGAGLKEAKDIVEYFVWATENGKTDPVSDGPKVVEVVNLGAGKELTVTENPNNPGFFSLVVTETHSAVVISKTQLLSYVAKLAQQHA